MARVRSLVAVLVLALSALSLVACSDDAVVVSCGRAEKVVVERHEYCAFHPDVAGPTEGDCPDALPFRVIVGGALVCADHDVAPEELPPEVCDAIGGCASSDGGVDAAGRDAGADDATSPPPDATRDGAIVDDADVRDAGDMGPPTGRVVQVTGGEFHTCSRRDTGSIACWGSNAGGERGFPEGTDLPFEPTLVPGLPDGAVDVASGRTHLCAAFASGDVWCWGGNASGQSAPSLAETTAPPTRVLGVVGAERVAAGSEHSCALLADSTVVCWGDARGDGDERPQAVGGLADVIELDAGAFHTCARTRAGRVLCWGDNREGQLGAGLDGGESATPVEVLGVTAAEGLAVGSAHACALERGTLSCWGNNFTAQLARDPPAGGSTEPSPIPIEGVTAVLEVAAGGPDLASGHTCARRALEILCWGMNYDGQTGDRDRAGEQATPSAVGLSVASLGLGSRHTCAVESTGRVFCWGDNVIGQLGVFLDGE
ncbi:MAG: hypothetical protein IT379_27995, partial [Deltaproteobacteria bacterium]|nr:hypothetical protein [Deltaproteobacteria bacterium]